MNKTKKTVLIIDDDRIFCDTVREILSNDLIEVFVAHSAVECLEMCSKIKVDVALLDQKLPDREGHTLCPEILSHNDQTKIIFSTAYPSFDNAVKAIRAGAFDYLSKPFELEELKLAVNQAFRILDLEKVERFYNYKNDKEIEETILIGKSQALTEIQRLVDVAASVDAPVLITGETGTGKSLVARSIHYTGSDKKAPFVSINCAAIPENLIEAELFGYDRGAFTGATAGRKGIFEMAEGGTLFLDEIGEMPPHLQTKLLSVLDDKKIKRLGGDTIRHVNVRIIAATSIDLQRAIMNKAFREDLYYRLCVITIHIPPLRDRREDIPELCMHLMKKMAKGREVRLSDSEMERLMVFDWSGNIRELKNVLERALILQQRSPDIRPSELLCTFNSSSPPLSAPIPASVQIGSLSLHEIEIDYLRSVLVQFSGNYTRTANALGISLSTLKRKIKKYGIK